MINIQKAFDAGPKEKHKAEGGKIKGKWKKAIECELSTARQRMKRTVLSRIRVPLCASMGAPAGWFVGVCVCVHIRATYVIPLPIFLHRTTAAADKGGTHRHCLQKVNTPRTVMLSL